MSASMLGVSFANSETHFDDLLQLRPATRHNRWPFVTSHSRMEGIDPFSFGRVWQPHNEDVFSPYQKKQPPVPSYAVIENEETCDGFLSHVGGSGSTPSPELRPTVSALNGTNQPASTDTVVEQVGVSSQVGVTSGFSAHQLTSPFQKLQVSTQKQLRTVELSSPSFNPYAEYPSVNQLATHHRSMEHTPVSTFSDESDSMENEQPTDLSMPKNAQQNLDSENTADENSCENASTSRGTYYGRSESPIRRLTYTHLSDVSNDSEEDSDENLKHPTTFTLGSTKKGFALPWISTDPVSERPNITSFHPAPSYAQVFVGSSIPHTFAAYIFWLLQSHFFELSEKVPDQNHKQKIIELGDNFYDDSDATRHGVNVADEYVQPVAEENEVIDLTQDDDDDEGGMRSEQLHVQHPTASPSDQQLLAEVRTVEHTTEQSTLPLQGSVSPMLTLTLPPEPHLESSTLSVDSIMSPEKGSTGHDLLSQPFSHHLTEASATQLLLPDSTAIPKRQCEKRPYRESESVCETAHFSGPKQLRRSPRLQSVVKESTCASENGNMRPQNHQSHHRPKPADQEAQSMAPSPPRPSPRLEAEPRKCSPATKKRSREPWDHKGLLRFVAQNAFTLPRHFWTERKEGEARRSMRLAKKMQRRRYFLRPRLHTKS